jgi:hypothetical protein
MQPARGSTRSRPQCDELGIAVTPSTDSSPPTRAEGSQQGSVRAATTIVRRGQLALEVAPSSMDQVRVARSASTLRPDDLRRLVLVSKKTARPRKATPKDAGLALLARIGERVDVDEGDQLSLSFPTLSPGVDPADTFELALLTSYIPDGGILWRAPTPLLWEIWRDVLAADVADVEPNPQEKERRDQANALLSSSLDPWTPSLKYERYRQLQNAWIDALIAVADAKADLDAGEPGAADRHAAAQATAARASQMWVTEGHKAEIEAAIEVIDRFGAEDPSVMWAAARDDFEMDTNWRRDAESNMEYPETTFTPSSMDDLAWRPIAIDATEMIPLADSMRRRFPELLQSDLFAVAADDDGQTVRAVHAEVAQIGVNRPWFRSQLLTSRAWRWPSGAEPLSTGAIPPAGRMPAYTVGLLLIRNLRADLEQPQRAPSQLGPVALGHVIRTRATIRPVPAGNVRDHRTETAPDRAGTVVRDHRTRARVQVRDHRTPGTSATTGTPPASHEATGSTVADDAPRIAAFICTLIPKAPNPDLTLFDKST